MALSLVGTADTRIEGGRNAVVSSKRVPWITRVSSGNVYLHYWDGSAWQASGLGIIDTNANDAVLAIDPFDNDKLWLGVALASSVELWRIHLSADHLSVTAPASATIANVGSQINGFDMILTPNSADNGRKLHLVVGREYTDTDNTYGDKQVCEYSYYQGGHTHTGGSPCPCNSSTCPDINSHTHDSFPSHSHSSSCGFVIAENDCITGSSSTDIRRYYYERWPISEFGAIGARETQVLVDNVSGSSSEGYLGAGIDWNHTGDGVTPPAGDLVVYLAHPESKNSTDDQLSMHTITRTGTTWGSPAAQINSSVMSRIFASNTVNVSYYDGKTFVAAQGNTNGSHVVAYFEAGAWTEDHPALDDAFGNAMGPVLTAAGGKLECYVPHYDNFGEMTLRLNTWSGGSWSGWSTVEGQAFANGSEQPESAGVSRYQKYGSVWSVITYNTTQYELWADQVSTTPDASWGKNIIGVPEPA